MRLLRIGIVLASLCIAFVSSAPAMAVGVRPLTLDLDMKPGETADFTLIVSSARRQLVHIRRIQVAEGQFQQPEPLRPITVEPDRVAVALRPGRVAVVPLLFRNVSAEALRVQVGLRDDTSTPRTVFDAIDVQWKGGRAMHMESRRTARAALLLEVPRNLDAGTHHGCIEIDVFAQQEWRDTVRVPMEVVVEDVGGGQAP